MPLFILSYVIGIWYAWRAAHRYIRRLPVALIALPVLLTPYVVAKKFPMERHQFKQSLEFVVENIRDGENLYVINIARRIFIFYRQKDDLFPGREVTFGRKAKFGVATCAEEIEQLSGTSWLLFTHFRTANKAKRWEARRLFEKLEADGYEILERAEFVCSGASKVRAP